MAMAVTNRLSAIAAEMGQLKNEIQERRRALTSDLLFNYQRFYQLN